MTVIEVGRKDVRLHIMSLGLGILVVCSVIYSIVLYNHVISLRHDVSSIEETIREAQVRNADLKNALYEKIEQGSPTTYLSEHGYTLDSNPQYEKSAALSKADQSALQ